MNATQFWQFGSNESIKSIPVTKSNIDQILNIKVGFARRSYTEVLAEKGIVTIDSSTKFENGFFIFNRSEFDDENFYLGNSTFNNLVFHLNFVTYPLYRFIATEYYFYLGSTIDSMDRSIYLRFDKRIFFEPKNKTYELVVEMQPTAKRTYVLKIKII